MYKKQFQISKVKIERIFQGCAYSDNVRTSISQKTWPCKSRKTRYNFGRSRIALVAQWIRAFACGAKGRVFESRRGRQLSKPGFMPGFAFKRL